ncbi:MAG: PilZ domain-containing protein [Bryobacteraceae bacterium]
MERRRNVRIQLTLQCRITACRGGQRWTGVTENMSRGDLLVSLGTDQLRGPAPSAGDPLLVEIELPANHAFGRKCMQCQTTVARLSNGPGGRLHLALRIHKMRFQNSAEAILDLSPGHTAPEGVVM